MIAIDTSAFIDYFQGAENAAVDKVDAALASGNARLPPVVLTELLSDPKVSKSVKSRFERLLVLEVTPGFWERAGHLRASVIARRHKAKLADTLIAQSCIDHDVPLIAIDSDFRHFVSAGLVLL